jgi:hypothetical protein
MTPAYRVAEVFSANRAKIAMRGRDGELTIKSFGKSEIKKIISCDFYIVEIIVSIRMITFHDEVRSDK